MVLILEQYLQHWVICFLFSDSNFIHYAVISCFSRPQLELIPNLLKWFHITHRQPTRSPLTGI